MDILSSNIPSSYRLIKVLFGILAISSVIAAIVFFTLTIEDSVQASMGELYSENSPKQYLAPVEAESVEILAQEGARVKKGDTLVVLKNTVLTTNYARLEKQIKLQKISIDVLQRKILNIDSKLGIQKKELTLVDGTANSKRDNMEFEKSSLEIQLKDAKEQLTRSKARVDKDYTLFQKGAISEREFRNTEKAFQQERNKYFSIEKEYNLMVNNLKNYGQEKSTNMEKQNLSIISSKSQRLDLENSLAQEKSELFQLEQDFLAAKKEMSRLNIISESEGFATAIFNLKKDLNFITKGSPLITVKPLKESKFYANLTLNEKEMKDVKIGQRAKIKVDAYNHYQFGVLESEIIQISKDDLNAFYVTADIKDAKNFDLKSGYKVQGEIILQEIKLSTYIFNSLFKKI